MIWVIVVLGLVIVGLLAWIAYGKPSASAGPDVAGEAKISADFDQKKAAENARIDKLDPQGVADDLSARLRK